MEIIKNSPPNLKEIKFKCDKPLHKKLNCNPILSLMNRHNFTVFLGKGGSGKSTKLIELIQSDECFKNVYHEIYLFCPPTSRGSISSKGKGFWEDNLDPKNIFDVLNVDNLAEVYERILVDSEAGFNSLIIFDDVQSGYRDKYVCKMLLQMNNNKRHLRTSIWMLNQNLMSVPSQIRMNVMDMFIFKLSKVEMENIYKQFLEITPEKLDMLQDVLFKSAHDFLFIDTSSKRLFNNWDEIVFTK